MNTVHLTRTEESRGKPTRFRVVRANGGHLNHAMHFGDSLLDGASLCGNVPVRQARMMVQRGRWKPMREGHLVTCLKCQAAEVKLVDAAVTIA